MTSPFEACARIQLDKGVFDAVFNQPKLANTFYGGSFRQRPLEQIGSLKVVGKAIEELREEYEFPSDGRQAYFQLRERLNIREIAPRGGKGEMFEYSICYRDRNAKLTMAAVNSIAATYLAALEEKEGQTKVEESMVVSLSPAQTAVKQTTAAWACLVLGGVAWLLWYLRLPRRNV